MLNLCFILLDAFVKQVFKDVSVVVLATFVLVMLVVVVVVSVVFTIYKKINVELRTVKLKKNSN